jgi:hypothetical protein
LAGTQARRGTLGNYSDGHRVAHFEGLIERLGRHGEMRTHIVLSTQFDGRPVERAVDDRPVSQSEGWRRR